MQNAETYISYMLCQYDNMSVQNVEMERNSS